MMTNKKKFDALKFQTLIIEKKWQKEDEICNISLNEDFYSNKITQVVDSNTEKPIKWDK